MRFVTLCLMPPGLAAPVAAQAATAPGDREFRREGQEPTCTVRWKRTASLTANR